MSHKTKTLNASILLRYTGIVLVGVAIIGSPLLVGANTVEELRAELQQKRNSLKETEEQIQRFRQEAQEKQREARTLQDQIGLIDSSVREIELTLNQTLAEIEKVDVELQTVRAEVEITEEEIAQQKILLAEYIRSIHLLDQQSNIAIFLKYTTFSEAISETSTLKELQNRGQKTLTNIQELHEELVTKRREIEDFRQSLESLRQRQEQQQQTLANQRQSKQRILDLTNEREAEYQNLIQSAQRAHQSAEAAISALDNQIREELRKQGLGNLPSIGTFIWPIQPIFGISCEFRCGGYPYAHLIGPHSGMDIPSYVGTPIKAPADGYVGRAFDSGNTNYSYIMLLHGDGISTVYGHVSGFAIQEGQMVTTGTVIGYTGGAPGTRGAGLSTGPHLHFEVRKNNVPINPRNYLP